MPEYKLKEIAEILDATCTGRLNPVINNLVIDSRTYVTPDDSLFFALVGLQHDGHNYIDELYNKGVRYFVVSKMPENWDEMSKTSFIEVDDTLKALQKLVTYHRRQFEITTIGITGSNGKTIIKEWLFQLMGKDKKIIRSPKSYNSQVGVPLSVWAIEEDHELAIFEAGISQVNEMQNIEKIISPTIGIFTNIGDAHQQNFMDYKHKTSEKLKLFANCEILIYCRDYSHIENQIKISNKFDDTQLFTWSQKVPADLFITSIEKKRTNTYIKAKFNSEEIEIKIPFIDDASIENAIHCWAVMLLGYDNVVIKKRMLKLQQVAMRLELKEGVNNTTIINDSYNSDLGSLSIALDFLNQQNQHKKRTLIISDIFQSSKNETGLYKEIADLVRNKKISRLIGVGETISRNSSFFKLPSSFYPSTEKFLDEMKKEDFHDETVLLKGSRKFKFEKISNSLQNKAHRTVLEIDLNAMIHNLNYYRSKLKKETKVVAMVKALSYGSGTFEIANILQYNKIDYLGVAFADEGVALRKAGISVPIIVMNPDEQSYETIIENNLEPEIFNLNALSRFSESVTKYSVSSYPIHIKLETGMNRMGFEESEFPELITLLQNHPNLLVVSVFSHLAASDVPDYDKFTDLQIEKFEYMSNEISNVATHKILRHILNSAGIERFPQAQYEMVRLGIGLYGISSFDGDKLANVSTLKSRISQIKNVTAGETIGYNLKGMVNRDSKIAIVPIGYSDGLRRSLSNGVGSVCINKTQVPIVGNVCMDMCMIDVTDVEAKEGDEVIIFGKDAPISELAKKLNTISYEILTGVSSRVKRVYIYE